jgi:hypothetical protein
VGISASSSRAAEASGLVPADPPQSTPNDAQGEVEPFVSRASVLASWSGNFQPASLIGSDVSLIARV